MVLALEKWAEPWKKGFNRYEQLLMIATDLVKQRSLYS